MASFFSDLGKSFQSAAKTIQKKTAEGMEASRRNIELRSLRDEQKKLFAALGETYYTARNDEGGKEQLDLLVRRIDELAERIKAVTAELDALNDKKRCPGCGAVVNMEAKFCPACGAKMPEQTQAGTEDGQEASRAEYCPGCGALRQGEARFCAVCGQPFASEEAKSEDARKPEVEINWPEAGVEEPPVEEPAQDGDEQP